MFLFRFLLTVRSLDHQHLDTGRVRRSVNRLPRRLHRCDCRRQWQVHHGEREQLGFRKERLELETSDRKTVPPNFTPTHDPYRSPIAPPASIECAVFRSVAIYSLCLLNRAATLGRCSPRFDSRAHQPRQHTVTSAARVPSACASSASTALPPPVVLHRLSGFFERASAFNNREVPSWQHDTFRRIPHARSSTART